MKRHWLLIGFIIFLLCAAAGILAVTVIHLHSNLVSTVKQQFQPLTIDAEDPISGKRDAKITIITFSSFTCPACKRNADVVQQLFLHYPDEIKLVWKDLPEDTTARGAALAARCAQLQGKFWPYHDQLFALQDKIDSTGSIYLSIANNVGLDPTLFQRCLSDQQPLDLIDKNVNESLIAQISSVPYSEVNGTMRVDGELTLSEWQSIIEQLH